MSAPVCRNCEAVLAGRWCHACGQDSRDPLRDRAVLVGELLDNAIGWDSRLWRTLRLLFGAPGALTDEFVAGRRARYLGPLRLYLIASVAFFACYALTPDPVLYTIAGLGDWRLGATRITYAARWLPTMMILILPGFALIIQLLYRDVARGFFEHLVFVLHFGAFAFLMIPAAQLVAGGIRALGVAEAGPFVLYAAHGANAAYLYLATLRHYRLGPGATFLRMLGFCALMTLLLGGAAALVQWLIEHY